ncbi:hypothetical protein GCM10012288_20550 [Malaciobacter pacificus]|uniref:Putative phosphatase (TPM domain) n=1 Tax=Malaciobacter pacificus TaxID=1080223 RepID=A0A5C2HDL8_9BACT|nr:TPM domain-containing protein [Malaciobacter pacificus]QEP35615.1 putative phosphatase (TPM domain) [Malaciobacter pacificus]GGD46167.1 hypothetical protein GCM10012288_20550 [Malaciobacter pacificus]
MKKLILLTLLFLNFLNANITQYFPPLEGRIIDQAHLLSNSSQTKLTEILKNHEEETSNQIVVVILNTLNGYEIADYSYQLGRFWGIGQKSKDNGVLLVIAMDEKKLRIEVGYGLEGALTDKTSYEIINYTIKPNFKNNNYEKGIFKAVDEIIQAIKGEYTPKIKNDRKNMNFDSFFAFLYFGIIFVSMIASSISRKLKSQKLYKISKASILSSFFGFFTFAIASGFTSFYLYLAIAITILVFIFNYLTARDVNFDKLAKYDSNSSSNSGSWGGTTGGFGSGRFSSGGGFSGGGGGFGGGGASGGW